MKKATQKLLLNYILGPLLLLLLLWLIYRQVIAKGNFRQQWDMVKARMGNAHALRLLYLALVLAPLNWACEAKKWQTLLEKVHPVSYWTAFRSTMTGMAFSLITPNRVGDFAGRILYMEGPRKKLMATFSSFIGSASQMCITSALGLAGLVYYNIRFPVLWAQIALVGAGIIVAAGIYLLFHIDIIGSKATHIKWLRGIRAGLLVLGKYSRTDLVKVLCYSLFRALIFNLQFVILVNFFGGELGFVPGFFLSGLSFWLVAVIPSVAMLELGVRGYVGLLLFVDTGLVGNDVALLAGSYMLWFLNLVIPAVLGSLLILTIRLIK